MECDFRTGACGNLALFFSPPLSHPLLSLPLSRTRSGWFVPRHPSISASCCSNIGYARARVRTAEREEPGEREGVTTRCRRRPCARGWETAPRALKSGGRATATTPHTRSSWGTDVCALSLYFSPNASSPPLPPAISARRVLAARSGRVCPASVAVTRRGKERVDECAVPRCHQSASSRETRAERDNIDELSTT